MSDRQKIISRLLADRDFRADYIRAKLDVLIPSQLRALRFRREKTQPELAEMAGMKQSRISAMETPGLVNFNRETLVRMAATHNVGLVVKFVPFSEMLAWENEYSQDNFAVTPIAEDADFLHPSPVRVRIRRRKRLAPRSTWRVETRSGNVGLRLQPASEHASQMTLAFEPASGARKIVELTPITSSGFVAAGLPKVAAGGIKAHVAVA